MKSFRKLLVLLCGALLFSTAGCQDREEIQTAFDAFLEDEFIQTMEQEYTALHVYVSDPAAFGIDMDQVEVGLGTTASMEDQEQAAEEIRASYEKLKSFPYDALSEEQKDSYDIYEAQLFVADQMNDEKFAYYASLFNSMNGLHYQFPTLLADWELRDETDLQNLITVVKDIRPYTDAALQYTVEQAEKGLLMIDFDSVLSYCERILDKGEDSSVLVSLCEHIDALPLSKEQKEAYQTQMKEAFQTSFLTAYEAICETLSKLRQESENNEGGLARFANGREYYELLLRQNSGTKRSVKEIRTMMEEAFRGHMRNIVAIAMEQPEAYEQFLKDETIKTDFTGYEEILTFIKERLETDFPKVEHLEYNIEEVNEEIASDSGITAYFNIPSLDGTQVKQLRVNPKTNDVRLLSTYLTVAHEGFAGHMYQYGYMYENLSGPFRKAIAENPAYTEGYATYAEYECLDYLEDLDPAIRELYKEYQLLNNALVILLDIGIHYEDWSVDDLAAYMEEQGLSADLASLSELYRQLQANPAAFVPYYVGYEDIARMKKEAREKLGERFADRDFHEALLESGTAPFEVVQRHIDAYVEQAK